MDRFEVMRAYVQIVDSGNYTRAAQQLNLHKATLSQQIRQLEDKLGTRLLTRNHVDATSLAAQLSLTNRLEEGSDSGTFGEDYPGYSWERSTTEYTTNGLYQVEFQVLGRTRDGHEDRSEMTILLYRPDSVRRVGR